MENLLTEKEKSRVKEFVLDKTSGWYEVEDCEVVEHLVWEHSSISRYNTEFYRVKVYCKFLNGEENEKRFKQVIVTKIGGYLGMWLDEYFADCLQDFLMEHFIIGDLLAKEHEDPVPSSSLLYNS